MSVQPKAGLEARMSVDEFLVWSEGRPGQYELVDGAVFAMSPQRAVHARVKYRVQRALDRAISAGSLSCEMFPDGMVVRVDAETSFEPDALVRCGDRLADHAMEAEDPLIVVEVLSPSTRHVDTGTKLLGYFRLPSVQHYLILDTERRTVIHHRRGAGELIETRIAASGELFLDPPSLTIGVESLFADP